MDGWICLHRKIRSNPIFNNMELLRLWLICLTEASHRDHQQIVGQQMVTLNPGQFVTGRFDLEKMYNDGLNAEQQKSGITVWRWLQKLESYEFLNIKTNNKFSVVSILNWDKYQNPEQQNEQQLNNKRTTTEQQVITNNNDNNDNNSLKEEKLKDNVPFSEIVSYLNRKADTNFKHTSKMTQKHIRARWKEGYQVEDFHTVIDKKALEWKFDPKMSQYLRPETLFGPKFENYLNQLIPLKGGQAGDQSRQGVQSGRNAAKGRADSDDEYDDITLGSYTAKVQ